MIAFVDSLQNEQESASLRRILDASFARCVMRRLLRTLGRFPDVTMFWVVRLLPRVRLSRAMFGAPISHRIQNRLQRQTIFCQGVINARRHLPKYLTANNSVSFQFTQLLGQYLLGDVWDVTLKLAKPTSAKTPDVVQDYRFPFPPMMSMVVRTVQF